MLQQHKSWSVTMGRHSMEFALSMAVHRSNIYWIISAKKGRRALLV